MSKTRYPIRLKDRETGKIKVIHIEAKSFEEAFQIAMRDYGLAYEVKKGIDLYQIY